VPARARRFVNWARTCSATPAVWSEPASEEEVAGQVRGAAAKGTRVKVVGAGHSWSDIACTDGVLLSLDRLGRVLDVHEGEVTVEAGIRLRALNAALAERGLALPVLGSIAEQSMAGAISTGTHGSAPRLTNLSDLVTGLRMVLADGSVADVSAHRDSELFAAARVGLGALGVITRATLRCVPAFRLEEIRQPMRFDEALAKIPDLAAREEFVKLWWLPHTPWVQVFRYRRTDAPSRIRRVARWVDEAIVNRGVFALLLGAGRLWPALIPPTNRLVRAAYFRPGRRVASSHDALTLAMPPSHQEIEYALPRDLAAEALRRTRALVERDRLRVNFVAELRFVAGDDAWMSPDYGRDSAHLGAYMARAPDLPRYFAAFESEMLALGGRPHWGKQFSATADQLRAAYPEYERFDALRRTVDPRGIFENAFLERVFARRTRSEAGLGQPAAAAGGS
jgi:L-gulono-1,4-lactone dehydrogenase